jgi:hypothetical protein
MIHVVDDDGSPIKHAYARPLCLAGDYLDIKSVEIDRAEGTEFSPFLVSERARPGHY